MRPVVARRIERERLALCVRNPLPQRLDVARVEDAVDLRVDAIKLDQVEAAIESLSLRVQVVRGLGDARAQWQPLDEPLRGLDRAQSGTGAGGHLLARRIGPGRSADRLAVAIAQRMGCEIDRR